MPYQQGRLACDKQQFLPARRPRHKLNPTRRDTQRFCQNGTGRTRGVAAFGCRFDRNAQPQTAGRGRDALHARSPRPGWTFTATVTPFGTTRQNTELDEARVIAAPTHRA